MSNLLDILQETADPNPTKIAKILGLTVEDVEAEMEATCERMDLCLVGCPYFILLKRGRKQLELLLK